MFFACFWCPGGTSRHRWDGPRAIVVPLSATGAPRVLNSSKNRFCEFSKIELSPTWEHVFGLSRSVPRGRFFLQNRVFSPSIHQKLQVSFSYSFLLDSRKLSSRLHESSFSASQGRSRAVCSFCIMAFSAQASIRNCISRSLMVFSYIPENWGLAFTRAHFRPLKVGPDRLVFLHNGVFSSWAWAQTKKTQENFIAFEKSGTAVFSTPPGTMRGGVSIAG